jgi:hypothetical protein
LGRLTLLEGYPAPEFWSSGGGSPAAHLRRCPRSVVLREGGLRGGENVWAAANHNAAGIYSYTAGVKRREWLAGHCFVLFSAMTGSRIGARDPRHGFAVPKADVTDSHIVSGSFFRPRVDATRAGKRELPSRPWS